MCGQISQFVRIWGRLVDSSEESWKLLRCVVELPHSLHEFDPCNPAVGKESTSLQQKGFPKTNFPCQEDPLYHRSGPRISPKSQCGFCRAASRSCNQHLHRGASTSEKGTHCQLAKQRQFDQVCMWVCKHKNACRDKCIRWVGRWASAWAGTHLPRGTYARGYIGMQVPRKSVRDHVHL